MTLKKKRFEILLTKSFWDALDYLVEEGIYLERQEAARDALRRLFRAYGIPPFYKGVEIPETEELPTQEEVNEFVKDMQDTPTEEEAEES